MKTVIHWFRRDLRIADNTALNEAFERSQKLLPVFILDDAFLNSPDMGAARIHCLLASLKALRHSLESLGYPLIFRRGDPEKLLPQLCQEFEADAVFCNREYEPHAQRRDARLFNILNEQGIGFEIFKDAVVWEELEVSTKAGAPYTVFTPYAKSWKARSLPPPRPTLGRSKTSMSLPSSQSIPDDPASLGFPLKQSPMPAGEQAAQKTLHHFIAEHLFTYGQKRDFPAFNATSHLSSFLHFGTIGIRTVLAQWENARCGVSDMQLHSTDVFLNELIWREFYIQIMTNFPHVLDGCFRLEYNRLAWQENHTHFQAWCEGQTGYPIIDAAMRCLNATGWMHNRARMLAAMFLSKDLMLPWQWGERYFMQQLSDGDHAANNGGWQWSAGTGTDAAPYFRIFNPSTQGTRFDPDGQFVRQWIPELAPLPNNCIHEPWQMTRGSLRDLHYPDRIVVHAEQRLKCLTMFEAIKKR